MPQCSGSHRQYPRVCIMYFSVNVSPTQNVNKLDAVEDDIPTSEESPHQATRQVS